MSGTHIIDVHGDVAVVRGQGRIAEDASAGFQQTVVDAVGRSPGGLVVIDLTNVSYMSSGGLRAIATGARLCRESNGQLALGAPSSELQEILAITGFDKLVPMHATLAAAMAALSADR